LFGSKLDVPNKYAVIFCRRVVVAGAFASTARAIIETPLELAKVMN